MDKIIVDLTSTGTFAIALFGAVFCILQPKFSRVSRSFAAFLAAIALNNVPDAFAKLFAILPDAYGPVADIVVWPSSFFLAPLFWLYVFLLTSPAQNWPERWARHLWMPALAVLFALIVFMSSPNIRNTIFSNEPEMGTAWAQSVVLAAGLFQLAVIPQIALYLILIIRRLMRFRLKLRDVYTSTEQHELRWIYVIGGLGLLFWITLALLVFFAFDPAKSSATPAFNSIASLAGFFLVGATVLWGLRQRPPLQPNIKIEQTPITTAHQTAAKYEKSALSREASVRLKRKLRSAMEIDHLHRDPNLTLWALAKHTGASSNYISQTLNEEIGETFFDFVNSYRIAEAITLLTTTNASVLTITYDVGFNARSSFYNAFKRVTGQTPSSYRKKMSQRDGLDDKIA